MSDKLVLVEDEEVELVTEQAEKLVRNNGDYLTADEIARLAADTPKLEFNIGSDGWSEIIGTSGLAANRSDADSASEILGELIQKSPAFKEYLDRRVNRLSRPSKQRAWQINFSATVKPGAQITIVEPSDVLFRIEELIVPEDGAADLWILGAYIGQKAQGIGRPPMSFRMLRTAGISLFDTCEPRLNIAFVVENRGKVPHVAEILARGKAVF